MAYGGLENRQLFFLCRASLSSQDRHVVSTDEIEYFRKRVAKGYIPNDLGLAPFLKTVIDDPKASDSLKAAALEKAAVSFIGIRGSSIVQRLLSAARQHVRSRSIRLREKAYLGVCLLSPIEPGSEHYLKKLFANEKDIYLRQRLAGYAMTAGFRFGLIEDARTQARVHADRSEGVVSDAETFAIWFLKGMEPHEFRDWPTLVKVLEENIDEFHFERTNGSGKWVRRRGGPEF
jgi:hypothetical protein